MDRDTAREEIRSRIKCTDFLEKSKSGLYCCPQPDCGSGHGSNGTGAVKYYPETNTWYCHACKRGGDVIDLYQLETGADYNTALSLLAQQIGITIDPYRQSAAADFAPAHKNDRAGGRRSDFSGGGDIGTPPEAKNAQRGAESPTEATADFTAYYEACQKRIEEPAPIDYLKKRGVVATAIYYGAGFDPQADPACAPGAMGDEYRQHPCPRIIFPCSKGYYATRSIDPETPEIYKKMNPARSKGAESPTIFNINALYEQEVQEVFITEGIFDALSIIETGAAAIALNGAGNREPLLKQLEQRKTAATLILCPDNDPNPKTAEKVKKDFDKLAAGLQRLEIPFITADINGSFKDANEALCADYYAFYETVQDTAAEAKAYKEKLLQEAQEAEQERQRRTGAGMIDEFLETVRTHKYEPVPTGITDIDKAIGGGFIRQQLILLGAAPGAGKSSLAQWIFEGMAKRGQACVYLNLEMSREQMLARSLSRIAAQNGEKIKATDILQGYQWDWTQEAVVIGAAERYKQEIAPNMIYNPDGVTATLDSILEYIETEAERAQAAGKPAPCIVLDYLQIVRGREREDEAATIKRAMASLKDFAIKHNTFCFVIMANNRASNRSGDVTMESGRDTSALEYGADLQLGLAYTRCLRKYYGDKAKSKDDLTPEEMRNVTLKITKGRWGGPGVDVNLYFDGETMTYTQTTADFLEDVTPRKAGRKL